MPTLTRTRPANGHDTLHGNLMDGVSHQCFTCDAPVSPVRFVEIQAKDRARIAKIEEEITARLLFERDAEIERIRQGATAQVEAVQRAATRKEAAIRREAIAAANAAVAPKLAKIEADRKRALDTQAEALAKKHAEELAAVKTAAFEDRMKVDALRANDKKTANELGDAGEIDLFERLIAEFPADQIARVAKGVNGPDVIQRVFANGAFTGRCIIYDNKNHKVFQPKWTAKLRQDQIVAQADHAVLVTTAFPPGTRHLLDRNGVIVVGTAHAIEIARILRRQVLQTHLLGLSNADRDEKTARLYALLTSDRAADRWDRMSRATTDLLDIEKSDAVHQEKTRNKRLGLVHAVRVVQDEFISDIDRIVGGSDD
jgi:hypothetical protein